MNKFKNELMSVIYKILCLHYDKDEERQNLRGIYIRKNKLISSDGMTLVCFTSKNIGIDFVEWLQETYNIKIYKTSAMGRVFNYPNLLDKNIKIAKYDTILNDAKIDKQNWREYPCFGFETMKRVEKTYKLLSKLNKNFSHYVTWYPSRWVNANKPSWREEIIEYKDYFVNLQIVVAPVRLPKRPKLL